MRRRSSGCATNSTKRRPGDFGFDEQFLSFKSLRAFGKRRKQIVALQRTHPLQYVLVRTQKRQNRLSRGSGVNDKQFSKEQTDFLVYCIEMYKNKFNLSGSKTQELFSKTGADIYILNNFEALHTTGLEYTLDDIHGFIEGGNLPCQK